MLRGEAMFVADIEPPDTLHVAFLRSPHAHARLIGVRKEQAAALDGVVDIVTARDLESVPGPIPVRIHPLPELEPFRQFALATEKVRYVGEPVAAVVACNRYVAEDAVQLLQADFEPLAAALDTMEAAEPGAPLLFEDQGTNVAYTFVSEYGDIEAAFAEADHVVGGTFAAQRHSGVPMETRGLVAVPDPQTGRLTVWGPTKVVHANREVVAGLLGLSLDQIRFVEPSVGGGFGIRGEVYPEDLLIPLLALRLGRPVKWIEDRSEHLVAANHSREQRHQAQLAFAADGRILGLRSRFWVDQGAYLRTHGVRVAEISAHTQPGPYRIPAYRCDVTCVLTNKTPTGTYRAPGRFEINFVRERLMDMAARKLGVEAVDLRRQNLVRSEDMPYEPGTRDFGEPVVFDTGDPPAVFDRTVAAVGYEAIRREQSERPRSGRRLGVGIVPFVEDGGLGGLGRTPGEYAKVAIEDGGVVVYSGAGDLGQGFETMLSQVCAEEFGIDPAVITVVRGDTDRVPMGGGTWASRGAILAGNATLVAARQLKARLREAGAKLLDVDCEQVDVIGGEAVGTDGRSVTFATIEASCGELAEHTVFTVPRMTYSPGAQAAVVEVDTETGVVRLLKHVIAYDVGRAINPMIVRGQIEGGAAQGIGGALLEEFVYDSSGQPLATSFMDYLLPTVAEIPPTEVLVFEDSRSPLNPLGVKGVGEVGPAGAGAAIASAVVDALDVDIDRLPITPDRVLDWLARKDCGGA